MTRSEYVPGVCNIGEAEITRRRRGGWIALVVTVVVLVALNWWDVNRWWKLLVFFPAAASASGLLQARLRFCVGFSRAGVFNFGELGERHRVSDEKARAADRFRGSQINLYSAFIGAAVAVAAVLTG